MVLAQSDKLSLELRTSTTAQVVGKENDSLGIKKKIQLDLAGINTAESKSLAEQIIIQIENDDVVKAEPLIKKLEQVIAAPVTESYKAIRTDGRKHGQGMAIAYSGAFVWEHTAPLVFLAAGQPQIAFLIEVMPDGIMIAGLYALGRGVANSKHRNKLYGGKANYKYYKRIRKAAKAELVPQGTVLIPLPSEPMSESQSMLKMKNAGVLDKVLSALQIKKRLSMRYLYKLALAHGADSEFIHGLKHKRELDDQSKVKVLIDYMSERNSQQFFEELKKEKSNFIVDAPSVQSVPVSKELNKWVSLASEVKDCKSFLNMVDHIPENQSARLVARLWEDVVMDYIIKHYKHLRIKMFHNINRDLEQLMANSEIGGDVLWTSANTATVHATVAKYCKD